MPNVSCPSCFKLDILDAQKHKYFTLLCHFNLCMHLSYCFILHRSYPVAEINKLSLLFELTETLISLVPVFSPFNTACNSDKRKMAQSEGMLKMVLFMSIVVCDSWLSMAVPHYWAWRCPWSFTVVKAWPNVAVAVSNHTFPCNALWSCSSGGWSDSMSNLLVPACGSGSQRGKSDCADVRSSFCVPSTHDKPD